MSDVNDDAVNELPLEDREVPSVDDGASPDDSAATAPKRGRRKWILVGVATVVLVAVAGGAAWIALGKRHASFGPVGTVVIPASLEALSWFGDNGLASAKRGDLWGYIDTAGNFSISPQFDGAGDFSEGLAAVAIGDKWGFADGSGKIVISPQYDEWSYSEFHGGLAVVKAEGKYGYIDKTGRQVVSPRYEFADAFSEGLAAVQDEEKWGFIEPDGKEAIPLQFEAVYAFRDGSASVKVGGRFGYIDKKGSFTINPQFDEAYPFSEGLAAVRQGNLWGFIDPSGNWAIPASFETAYSFSEGLAAVMNKGKWGYINPSGDFVIAQNVDAYLNGGGINTYYSISNFDSGVAAVRDQASSLWGLLARDGTWALPPTYASLYACHNGLAAFSNNLNADGYSSGPYGFISCG